jgi:hypothetical protein
MRRWFENRLARLLAVAYAAERARAIAELPHNELSCDTTDWSVVGGPDSGGPVQRQASQSSNTKRQLAQRTIYVGPPEQSEGNNA